MPDPMLQAKIDATIARILAEQRGELPPGSVTAQELREALEAHRAIFGKQSAPKPAPKKRSRISIDLDLDLSGNDTII